ncbi:MAG: hypothetical protein V1748_03170 [Actinomycetota bacterium]
MAVDPIILGHNQFIGVSHLSQDAARSRVERFSEMGRVGELVRFCVESGVRGMMLSTHPRARDILDYLKAEGLADELTFYPLVPYAQGYVRRMNAVGMRGMVREIFSEAPLGTKADIAWKGSVGYLRKDFTRLLGAFTDIEMLTFRGFRVGAVFLHDAFVDLALALGAGEQVRYFAEHVEKRHGAPPAFVTMNFPLLVDSFERWGISRPLVMTTFNKAGFQMNPSREACEEALGRDRADVVAMSTLAAGYLKPREAYEYLASLPGIRSVAVGVSTPEHARETFDLISEKMGFARRPGAEGA